MALDNILTGDTVNAGRAKINANNGEVNTHISASNPHGTTAADVGALAEADAHALIDAVDVIASASGALSFDLGQYRAGRATVTGNVTGIAFTNVPASTEMPTFTLSIWIDAAGNHTIAEPTGITRWLQGTSWAMLNTEPNAKNVIVLFWDGADLCATMLDTGATRNPDYTLQFEANETLAIPFAKTEDIALDDVTVRALDGGVADGTIEFQKNGGAAESGTVTFNANEVLNLVRSGASAPAVVRIPSYAP